MGAMIPYMGTWVRLSRIESETIAEPRLCITVQWVIAFLANSNWPSLLVLSYYQCHVSSLIVDHSHDLPFVYQWTSCLPKAYLVSWFVIYCNTWCVRWLVPSLVTWNQVTWWFSTCPLFLRITWWSYHGVHLWDFQLRALRTWCRGLCPWQQP
jgi:hypothetical protein